MAESDLLPTFNPTIISIVVFVFISFIALSLMGYEYYSFNYSTICFEEILLLSPRILGDLAKSENREIITVDSEESMRKLLLQIKRTGHYYCRFTKKPFTWFSFGDKSYKGSPLLFQCSKNGHGWQKKFAWGCYYKNGSLRVVKILSDGTMEETQ